MPVRERRVEMDLSAAERRYLDREEHRDDPIRRYVETEVCALEDLGRHTLSRRKLSAAIRADREALQEVVAHALVHDNLEDLRAYRTIIEARTAELAARDAEIAALRQEVQVMVAAPAMAVHSSD